MTKWSFIYKKAIGDDGTLFFPERLSQEFLDNAKRTMGSYLFANQYQNEIIPAGEAPFKPDWKRRYTQLPTRKNTFAFIDPAISQEKQADFTALTVIDVDVDGVWYLRLAQRFKITPTQIMNLVFKVVSQFKPNIIGIEDVAYQKALLYMIDEESRRRQMVVPIKGINPGTTISKELRILGLVPRFEWGRILLAQGLTDFEMEYDQFPRGSHDDLLDSLSQMEQIVFYPTKEKEKLNEPHSAHHPDYERWFIQNLAKRRQADESSE